MVSPPMFGMKRRAQAASDQSFATALMLVTPVSIEEVEVLLLGEAPERDQMFALIGLIQKMAERLNVDLMRTPGASKIVSDINFATDIRIIRDAWLRLATMNKDFNREVYAILTEKVAARKLEGDTSALGALMKKLVVGK